MLKKGYSRCGSGDFEDNVKPRPQSKPLSFSYEAVLRERKSTAREKSENVLKGCRIKSERKIKKDLPRTARTKSEQSPIVLEKYENLATAEMEEIDINETFTESFNILPPRKRKVKMATDIRLKVTYLTWTDQRGYKIYKPLRYVRFQNVLFEVLGTLPENYKLNTAEISEERGSEQSGTTDAGNWNNSGITVVDESNNDIFDLTPSYHWADIYVKEENLEDEDDRALEDELEDDFYTDRYSFNEIYKPVESNIHTRTNDNKPVDTQKSGKKRKLDQTQESQSIRDFPKQIWLQESAGRVAHGGNVQTDTTQSKCVVKEADVDMINASSTETDGQEDVAVVDGIISVQVLTETNSESKVYQETTSNEIKNKLYKCKLCQHHDDLGNSLSYFDSTTKKFSKYETLESPLRQKQTKVQESGQEIKNQVSEANACIESRQQQFIEPTKKATGTKIKEETKEHSKNGVCGCKSCDGKFFTEFMNKASNRFLKYENLLKKYSI